MNNHFKPALKRSRKTKEHYKENIDNTTDEIGAQTLPNIIKPTSTPNAMEAEVGRVD
jgi:hypothetical protein